MAVTAEEARKGREERAEAGPGVSKEVSRLTGGRATADPFSQIADEIFLGRDPQIDIVEEGTLTPEQEAVLKALLAAGPQAAGQVTGGQIDVSQLSLDDLANLRASIAGGQASQTFGAITERAQDPEARQEAFEAQSQPLIEEAQRATKTVGREFGEGGFFSSERQQADKDVAQAFARAETELISKLIREDEDRAIAAATGLTQIDQIQAQLATTQLQVELQAAIASGNNELAAQIQNSINQLQSQAQFQQLLGVKARENIVLAEGGTAGQGGAVGGILGAIF